MYFLKKFFVINSLFLGLGIVGIVNSQDFDDYTPHIVGTLNDLKRAVASLKTEQSELSEAKQNLKRILADCGCGDTPRPTPAPVISGCRAHPRPCYPGVSCEDLFGGQVRCGACPTGYIGDGRTCRAGITCAQRPCFRGVQCFDTMEGFECGPCPVNYQGDGITCVEERPRHHCDNTPGPCFPGVQCFETGLTFECGPCPRDMEGDGQRCVAKRRHCDGSPCHPGGQCREVSGGYECICLSGYEGGGVGRRCTEVRRHCDSNPCFRGVQCYESSGTFRCGPCPRDYEGDGQRCTEVRRHCDSNPCHPGGQCYETAGGYDCVCSSGYEGDGRRCWKRSGCAPNPCYPGVHCRDSDTQPYYICGDCPDGFSGNGRLCKDINECTLAEPCDPRVPCLNLEPGFRCDPCPAGFTGSSGVQGTGLHFARAHRQICLDINECLYDNGGCAEETTKCINTEGSYHCEECKVWTPVSPARPWPFNFT